MHLDDVSGGEPLGDGAHVLELIVDRLRVRGDVRERIAQSLETALEDSAFSGNPCLGQYAVPARAYKSRKWSSISVKVPTVLLGCKPPVVWPIATAGGKPSITSTSARGSCSRNCLARGDRLSMTTSGTIEVRGARTHNLKNISLGLPRGAFIVVTGPSGCSRNCLARGDRLST